VKNLKIVFILYNFYEVKYKASIEIPFYNRELALWTFCSPSSYERRRYEYSKDIKYPYLYYNKNPFYHRDTGTMLKYEIHLFDLAFDWESDTKK
jgi:hypothetical protein